MVAEMVERHIRREGYSGDIVHDWAGALSVYDSS